MTFGKYIFLHNSFILLTNMFTEEKNLANAISRNGDAEEACLDNFVRILSTFDDDILNDLMKITTKS